MFKTLVRGLLFGTGFGIAFVAVVVVSMQYFSDKYLEQNTTPNVEVPPGKPQVVIPQEETVDRRFELYKDIPPYKISIPPGGGVLSLAIVDSPKGAKRPSTVQAWVTESKAYLIRTDETTPTVSEVKYPESEPADFASELVWDHADLQKGNSTMPVSSDEVNALKDGRSSGKRDHMNGALRITSEGVVFFLPNEYET